ncbi:hypothetical protein NDU88_002169 [Pleurodeles waltl]|uniref:Uncharacterized protein n=1 Tax=Pleurodeles waltl TaxID=8319 RepID=A0AAV7LBJ7_PLEWA|nr:hypothetical protein NDU88_002169 [Pleurodeles waltl]
MPCTQLAVRFSRFGSDPRFRGRRQQRPLGEGASSATGSSAARQILKPSAAGGGFRERIPPPLPSRRHLWPPVVAQRDLPRRGDPSLRLSASVEGAPAWGPCCWSPAARRPPSHPAGGGKSGK